MGAGPQVHASWAFTLTFDPLQEQWDRLLILYPTSLAIFSEEADGLCFKVGAPHMGPPQGGALCTEVGGGSSSGGTCISGPVGTEHMGPARQPASLVSSDVGKEGPVPWRLMAP